MKKPYSKNELYIGKYVDKKKIDEVRKEILEPKEELFAIFNGAPLQQDGKTLKSGITLGGCLLLTDKRVIFYWRGLFGKNTEVFKYNDIHSVEARKKLLVGQIIINIHGAIVYFHITDKSDTDIATKMIREMIDKNKAGKLETKESPLDVLKIRYAKGEITKEEFEQMKKDLK
jgi:hypothetical protein